MGRRQVVESVNAALKGVFTDLGRGFMRVMGQTKMTVMLGFTLAAYNLDRIRSFRAKHRLDEEGRPIDKPKQTRARRRTGTWTDVIDGTRARRADKTSTDAGRLRDRSRTGASGRR